MVSKKKDEGKKKGAKDGGAQGKVSWNRCEIDLLTSVAER